MAFDIMYAGRYIMAAASGTTNVADESVSDVIDSAAEATNEAAQEVNQFVQFVQDNIPNIIEFGIKVILALVFFFLGSKFLPGAGQAGLHILPDGHMRKQRVLLKKIPHFSLLGRHIDFLFRVIQHPAIQGDPAGIRRLDTRDTFERHALSAAGRFQQTHTSALHLKRYI